MFKPIVAEPSDMKKLLFKNQYNSTVLAQKIREEAKNALLESKNSELLNNDDLALWNILEKYKNTASDHGKNYITYQNFLLAKKEVCSKAKHFFTATIFSKLCHGERFSRVNILNFFNYVMRTGWLQQTRIGISLYDASGEGYLRVSDLEDYITELIPSLCKVAAVAESFKTYYVCTATRKFFFFLDPMRTGRVRICDILACGFLDAILELREVSTSLEQLESNWFSLESAQRVYANYLRLDTDQNGMLSRQELAGYNNGSLTDVFLDRVFQECPTYEGEMDYKTFLDFVLAMENRSEPQSIGFLFRIIDLSGKGRLCCQTLEYYFNSVQEHLADVCDMPRCCDVLSEIFDMVRPPNPDFITLDDLLKSGKGDTVLAILIDVQAFLMYESREALTPGVGTETMI